MASDFFSSIETGTELERMFKETFLLFDIKYLSEGREGCSVLHLGQRLLIGVHPGCEECRVRAGKACITCTAVCSVLKHLLAFVACLSGS